MTTEEQEALDPQTSAARLRGLSSKSLPLARLVAQNPAAPPELLFQFASTYNQDPALLTSVISNPNTPKEALIRFGWSQPRALIQNPIFEILLLEDPLILESLPEPTLLALLAQPDAPLAVLELNISHKSVYIQSRAFSALLSRIKVTPELLMRFAEHPNTAIAVVVAEHPLAPRALLERLVETSFARGPLMCAVAHNPNTPPELLLRLSEHPNEQVLLSVAKNSAAPTAALSRAANTHHLMLLASIAAHPNTDLETLERLSFEEDEGILCHIARRAQLTPEILQRLCGHPSPSIHHSILQNKDAAHLRRLFYRAGHLSAKIGASPAEQLDAYPSPDPSLPQEDLDALMRGMAFARSLVARHPKVSHEALLTLAQDKHVMVRSAVIQNQSTPADVLLSRKHDPEERLRIALAQHPNCPLALFFSLANDRSPEVRLFVASYHRTPHVVLKEMFNDLSDTKGTLKKTIAKNPGIDLSWLLTLAKYRDASLRQCVAKNPAATDEILRLLAADESDAVRAAVAAHPKLPQELLDILSQDDAPKVSAEIQRRAKRRK